MLLLVSVLAHAALLVGALGRRPRPAVTAPTVPLARRLGAGVSGRARAAASRVAVREARLRLIDEARAARDDWGQVSALAGLVIDRRTRERAFARLRELERALLRNGHPSLAPLTRRLEDIEASGRLDPVTLSEAWRLR